MIQGRGETWRIVRRGERAEGWRPGPGPARKAALLIAVWVACIGTAGAGNMIVTLKADETKPIEATEVLFENENLRIVQPAPLPAITKPVSAVLRIEPKDKDGADEMNRLQKDNASLRDENTSLTKKLQEREKTLTEYMQASKNDANLDKETSRAIQAREVEDLKKANKDLKGDLQRKDDMIASLNKDVEAARALASPPKPALDITGVSLSTTTLKGVLRVQGEITNKDQVPYSRVVLEVLVRDAGNKPLGKTHTFVTELEPGTPRTFTADLELVAKEGMKTEVKAVAARTKAK